MIELLLCYLKAHVVVSAAPDCTRSHCTHSDYLLSSALSSAAILHDTVIKAFCTCSAIRRQRRLLELKMMSFGCVILYIKASIIISSTFPLSGFLLLPTGTCDRCITRCLACN